MQRTSTRIFTQTQVQQTGYTTIHSHDVTTTNVHSLNLALTKNQWNAQPTSE
eukprot:m.114650 g.114650  ORF g.114650 m.114650 type:complete len:52 (-) comp13546_c0_seq1:185-340(-)